MVPLHNVPFTFISFISLFFINFSSFQYFLLFSTFLRINVFNVIIWKASFFRHDLLIMHLAFYARKWHILDTKLMWMHYIQEGCLFLNVVWDLILGGIPYRYVTASCVTRSLCHKYDRMSVWHNGCLTQWAHPYAHCVTPPMLIASHPQRSLCHRLTHTQYYIFTVINSILKFRPKIPMTPFLGLKIHVWPAKINFYFGNQVVESLNIL